MLGIRSIKSIMSFTVAIALLASVTIGTTEKAVAADPSLVFDKIESGGNHTLALTPQGTVYSWGYNMQGQLGDGTKLNKNKPVEVTGLTDIVEIIAGANHSLALKSDGTVYAWGNDQFGQLGDGVDNTNKTTPVQVANLTNVTKIRAGGNHSFAITGTGDVYAWGYNYYSQLGNGLTTDIHTPTKLNSLTGVTDIKANSNYSIALLSDGTLSSWGRNDGGQLGSGGTANITTPQKINGVSNVTSLELGTSHVLALDSNGDIYGWGSNYNGQLGDGTNLQKNTPVKITTMSQVVEIKVKDTSSTALTSQGKVYSWGYNNVSQLGDGTTTNRNLPLEVTGLVDIVEIERGDMHSFAITSTGDIYAWGINSYGELGDGTNVGKTRPSLLTDIKTSAGSTPPPPSGVGGDTQSHDVTAIVGGGDLTLWIPEIITFGQIKLGSQPKIVNTSFDDMFNIKDSRGSGEGWRLDVTASRFTEVTPGTGFQSGTSANILPIGSLTLSPLSSIVRVGAGTGALPTSKLLSPTIIDDGPITVSGANIGEGMGEFNLTFGVNALSLAVDPATAKIDKVNYPSGDTPYASTLTWTLVSAP